MPIINIFDAQNLLMFTTQMVFSAINHNITSEVNDSPSVANFCHSPNNTPLGSKSWTQTVKTPKRNASFNNTWLHTAVI